MTARGTAVHKITRDHSDMRGISRFFYLDYVPIRLCITIEILSDNCNYCGFFLNCIAFIYKVTIFMRLFIRQLLKECIIGYLYSRPIIRKTSTNNEEDATTICSNVT